MVHLAQPEIWFVTGSQHLYGPKTLEQVARDSQAIVTGLNAATKRIPLRVAFTPVVKSPEEVRALATIFSAQLATVVTPVAAVADQGLADRVAN